jgi:DNA polymerase III subunit delta
MSTDHRPGPFRVLFGDENHLLNQALDEIRSKSAREIVIFDGDGLDAGEVVSFCEERASGRNRGVIVEDAHKLKNGDALLKFVKDRDPTDKSVFLMFVIRSDKLKDAWMKMAAERGKIVKHVKPKPWETDKQIGHIHGEAKRLGLHLDKGVPELLLKVLGYDLALIANELGKAAYLVEGNGAVSKDIILSLVPHVFPAQPFEVAEAAASKRPKQAMTLLGFVYRNLGDGASVPIAYALMRLVERLIVARNLSDRGASTKEISERLGVHEYAYKVNLLPLVRRHDVARLADQMKILCRLDTLIKGAATSKRTHVELAVLSLATT